MEQIIGMILASLISLLFIGLVGGIIYVSIYELKNWWGFESKAELRRELKYEEKMRKMEEKSLRDRLEREQNVLVRVVSSMISGETHIVNYDDRYILVYITDGEYYRLSIEDVKREMVNINSRKSVNKILKKIPKEGN